MSSDPRTRLEFLQASRARLGEQLDQLSATLDAEIRDLQGRVLAARELVGDSGGTDPEAEPEAVKQAVREAIERSAQGARARKLLAQVAELEARVGQLDREIAALEGRSGD